MASTSLEDLIKQAKDDYRQFVSEQPNIQELSQEQIKDLMKQASDKEAEYLAKAIQKYVTSEITVELIKIKNEIAKINRRITNS